MSQNNDELYSLLFAVRISFQDTYECESDIIRELKNYLIDSGENPHLINKILHEFYQYYGINIPLHDIEQVPVNNNAILNNMLGFLLNQDDFDDSNELDENIQEYNNPSDDSDDSNNSDDSNESHESNESNETNVHVDYNVTPLNSNNQEFSNIFENNIQTIPIPINLSHNSMINALNSLFNGIAQTHSNSLFQDVVITVDNKELEKLKSFKLENNLDVDCSICMGHMEKNEIITELNCLHSFHTDCIEPYLKQYNYKCPVCRSEVGKVKYNI